MSDNGNQSWEKLLARTDELAKSNHELKEQLASFMSKGGDYRNGDMGYISKCAGVKNLPELMNKNIALARGVPVHMKAHLIQLKEDLQLARLEAQLFHGNPIESDMDGQIFGPACKSILETEVARNTDLGPRLKAFDTVTNSEWVPTIIGSTYVEEYELDYNLHKLFQEINLPSKTYDHPVQNGRGVARGVDELAEASEGSFGTSTIQFQAQKLVEYYKISEEMAEGDSAANIVLLGRNEVIKAQLRAYDEMCISGKISAALDSDVVAANDARRLQDGLRTRAIDNSANGTVVDFANATINDAGLRSLRAPLGKYAVRSSDLLLLPSPAVYLSMLDLDSVKTQEKIGNDMTMKRGVLNYWLGVALYNSEAMRDDLNDAGVYDGVTTDRGSILIVNKNDFMFGKRRPIRVRAGQDPRPEFDRRQIVSYSRVAFNGFQQSATRKTVAYGVNIKIT